MTVIDQTDKSLNRLRDSLGRLLEVYQDPIGPGNPDRLNYQTSYSYETVDDFVM